MIYKHFRPQDRSVFNIHEDLRTKITHKSAGICKSAQSLVYNIELNKKISIVQRCFGVNFQLIIQTLEIILENYEVNFLELNDLGINVEKLTELEEILSQARTLTFLNLAFNNLGLKGFMILLNILDLNNNITNVNIMFNDIDFHNMRDSDMNKIKAFFINRPDVLINVEPQFFEDERIFKNLPGTALSADLSE